MQQNNTNFENRQRRFNTVTAWAVSQRAGEVVGILLIDSAGVAEWL